MAAEVLDKPLLVSASRARRMIGVGNTKFWALVKSGRVQLAEVGGRRMVIVASLEALARPAGETKVAA